MAAATLTVARKPGGPALAPALTNVTILIVVGVLATTLGQPFVLGRLPLQNLLKNELHIGRAANAAFFFWAGLPWYFKPIAGVLTDAFPLLGSRRKSYILISSALAILAWAGLLITPHTYGDLLWACIVISVFMVVASTVVGAFMVEAAQAGAGSGRLTAIRQFVEQVCLIIRGPASGYLASIAFGWTAGACGAVMFLLVPVTALLLAERRAEVRSSELLGAAADQLKAIAGAKTMWAVAGLMLLFYAAPGISTAVFYVQQNDLKMSTQGQGVLGLIYGVSGIAAAVSYGFACRRWSLRPLLLLCLLGAGAGGFSLLFYGTIAQAQAATAVKAFGYTLAELALMDLAIRATPRGSEGLGFSLLMSVRNVILFASDWLGSAMLEKFHLSFSTLVIVNSAATLVILPAVLFLPRVLVRGRDRESPHLTAAPAAPADEARLGPEPAPVS